LDKVKANLLKVQQNIEKAAYKSGRKPADIILVAVTKTVESDTIAFTHEQGISNFGENRVQQLKRKMESLPEANWHLIGRLQTNKVKDVVGKVSLIHSLDRWNLAEELNRRGEFLGVKVPTLLQVNISGEEQKAGITAGEAEVFLDSLGQLKNLRIYGFMTMAPWLDNVEEARPIFKELFQLKEKLKHQKHSNVELKYLSMGMSQDYEIAIEEGANIVRVGSAIFSGE